MIRFEPKKATVIAAPCSARTSTINRLADTICELGYSGEAITEEALALRGFPKAVVLRIGNQAQEVARRRAVRQIGG